MAFCLAGVGSRIIVSVAARSPALKQLRLNGTARLPMMLSEISSPLLVTDSRFDPRTYVLRGNTLTICDNAPNLNKGRLIAFKVKTESGIVLIAFERKTEDN